MGIPKGSSFDHQRIAPAKVSHRRRRTRRSLARLSSVRPPPIDTLYLRQRSTWHFAATSRTLRRTARDSNARQKGIAERCGHCRDHSVSIYWGLIDEDVDRFTRCVEEADRVVGVAPQFADTTEIQPPRVFFKSCLVAIAIYAPIVRQCVG